MKSGSRTAVAIKLASCHTGTFFASLAWGRLCLLRDYSQDLPGKEAKLTFSLISRLIILSSMNCVHLQDHSTVPIGYTAHRLHIVNPDSQRFIAKPL